MVAGVVYLGGSIYGSWERGIYVHIWEASVAQPEGYGCMNDVSSAWTERHEMTMGLGKAC